MITVIGCYPQRSTREEEQKEIVMIVEEEETEEKRTVTFYVTILISCCDSRHSYLDLLSYIIGIKHYPNTTI